ncbi:hypothetical protein DA075_10080 [Methylobacterium currus]|uniref:Uncharacterized protein n=1 Tax=Methylobacterium currus TaxID=2051553 RepID=A0A2R4WI57_9HYPH|nr:hypothetical protein [Methylobacterium currus]AWB21220.1 hypothetical protein DA075_10080 [Methylobacterium currus]
MSPNVYGIAASVLRGIAEGLMLPVHPLLRWSRWCEDRAWRAAAKAPPEWLRRFWARDRPGHRQEGRDRG